MKNKFQQWKDNIPRLRTLSCFSNCSPKNWNRIFCHLKKQSITTLHSSDDKNIEHPKLINQEFLDFYKLLYKSQGVEEAEIQNFLSKLDIPVLCDNDRKELEKEISKEEIQLAVAALAGGKTPGLDGFSMDFYKTFFFFFLPINVYGGNS